MEIELINGRFTVAQAEELLTAIIQTKIAFHQKKIRSVDENEEDIGHSEKRILQLEKTLRNVIQQMKEKNQTHTNLNAHIEINTMPGLTQ